MGGSKQVNAAGPLQAGPALRLGWAGLPRRPQPLQALSLPPGPSPAPGRHRDGGAGWWADLLPPAGQCGELRWPSQTASAAASTTPRTGQADPRRRSNRWLPESARWLLTKKEVESAHSYLSRCAKVNGKKDFHSKITMEILQKTVITDESRNYFYWHLLKTSKLRKITLCSATVWFGVSFTYYGITLNISGFSLDPYMTQFMFGAIEIPAKVCVYFVLDRIGRRHCQAWTLIATGFLIALNACIPAEHGHVRSAVAILGKGFSEASFTTVFLYTAELYPTVLRQSGIGCCSFVARIASSLAPMIMLLDDTWRYLPPVIFSTVAVLSGMVAFLLTETTNIQLPETIEDVEDDRNKNISRTKTSQESMHTEIALEPMSPMSTDVPLCQQQEANSDCDMKLPPKNSLLANGMDTSGC